MGVTSRFAKGRAPSGEILLHAGHAHARSRKGPHEWGFARARHLATETNAHAAVEALV